VPPDAAAGPVRLALEPVPVTPDVLDGLHALLGRAWARCPEVGEADRTAVELAVAEIAANVVEHTRAAGHVLELVADVAVHGDRVEVDLRDTGRPAPVDLAAVRLPGADAERGRGLAMAQMVTDVAYVRDGGRNHWRIVRHRA
jgi:serine/threonine-protein kinase RsbW